MIETERMYLPVKFLPKQYADEMMRGRILMRPLKDLRAHLFCMYRMQYDPEGKKFEDIPKKVEEFGNTAVVILDPAEFFSRLAGWCGRCFGQKYQLVAGDVTYDSALSDKEKANILVKDEVYKWQKEVSLAAVLSPNLMPMGSGTDGGGDPDAEAVWYTEMGDLSDIAMEMPVEELTTEGFDASGLKPEILQNLEGTRQIEAGVLAREYIFFQDYSTVYPDQEWITFWQEIFGPEEWIPITEMRELVPGGAKTPVLSFRGVDGKRRAVFLPNRAAVTLAEEDRVLLGSFMELDTRKGHVGYPGICVISHVNLGNPDRKYDACYHRSYMSERDICLHGGNYHEIDTLALSYLNGRNIWGMDVADRKLMFQCELRKNLDMANAEAVMREIEEIIRIAKEQTDKLLECEDAYDGFKNL